MDYLYQEPLNYNEQIGVVLGGFVPLHKGHLDLIYRAKKECPGGAIVVVCGYDNDRGCPNIPLSKRYQMVREFFKDDPLVAVYALSDDEMGIAQFNEVKDWKWDIWLTHFFTDIVKLNSGLNPNTLEKRKFVFYTGEPEYAKSIGEMGYQTITVDRNINRISGTVIRSNPLKYWDNIAWTYRREFSHNILITGTASEGKTTLVQDIGRYFNMPYSYEWARGYMTEHNIADWEFDARDFIAFLYGQYEYNRKCIESRLNSGIFISDTDALVTDMYAKHYALKKEFKLALEDYNELIHPLAMKYASRSKWNMIFIALPKFKGLVDDHQRYMGDNDYAIRKSMSEDLVCKLNEIYGESSSIAYLTGSYYENFMTVKNYIESVRSTIND